MILVGVVAGLCAALLLVPRTRGAALDHVVRAREDLDGKGHRRRQHVSLIVSGLVLAAISVLLIVAAIA